MKTSVIKVGDMLSVWSVDEVEKRIGEVPGVESVTVNYTAESATVRFDETRLKVADIKSTVRQRGYDSTAPAAAMADEGREGHTALGGLPATSASAAPKLAPDDAAATTAASALTSAAPKSAPVAQPDKPGRASNQAGHGNHDKHEGHSPAMFRDRFWLSLALTVPVVIWSAHIQELLGYRAPAFPGSDWIGPALATVVFV